MKALEETLYRKQLLTAVRRELPGMEFWVESSETPGYLTLMAKTGTGEEIRGAYPDDLSQERLRGSARHFIRKICQWHAKNGKPFAYVVRQNKFALWVRVEATEPGDDALAVELATAHLRSRGMGGWRLVDVARKPRGEKLLKHVHP